MGSSGSSRRNVPVLPGENHAPTRLEVRDERQRFDCGPEPDPEDAGLDRGGLEAARGNDTLPDPPAPRSSLADSSLVREPGSPGGAGGVSGAQRPEIGLDARCDGCGIAHGQPVGAQPEAQLVGERDRGHAERVTVSDLG